ncbi:MAG: immunoglobulin domain-containing protein [Limisphaerales bacterium]
MRSILIPIGLACACTSIARAAYGPITLTPGSYNADVVVEKTATPPLVPGAYTTATLDNGSGNTGDTWVEAGFFTNTAPVPGLPPAGTTITSASFADHLYQFAPSYKANNAIMLDASSFNGVFTFTFTTPTAFQALSFLGSGGNGGCTFQWTIHHADGTTETGTTSVGDWFNGSNPAFTPQGRINAQGFTLDNYNGGNPRLYGADIVVTNTSSAVSAVDLQYVSSGSGAHTGIMAVSGQAPGGGNFNPITVTGYNADIVVEASAGPATDGGALLSAPFTTFTTVSMDGGTNNTGNTWYEQGYVSQDPLTGLPPAGSILVSTNLSDHSYQLAASYKAPNAIYADSNNPIAQITFANPAPYSALSFLNGAGNGPVTVGVVAIHQDGTLETNVFTGNDWFSGAPAAFTANGRVDLDTGVINNLNNGAPHLFEAQFPLTNTTSPVTGAYIAWTSIGNPSASSRFVVLAVSGVRAGYYPMALAGSSYNADIIVEKAATPPVVPGGYTTASMDGGSANNGNAWCEMGLFSSDVTVGLPPAGTTITDLTYSDHQYTFAPSYKANNAIMLDATSFNGLYTFTLATPAPYAQLCFLTSGGNGGCVFQWTAHHADGTTDTGQQPSADWFNGANYAFIANARVDAQAFTLNNYNSQNPRLYGKNVTLANTTSPVTSIDLQYVSSASGAHTCIMAVSGQAPGGGNFNPITVTGYNADIVVEAAAGPLSNAGALSAAPLTAFTTATMDAGTNNTGNTWYEQGYVPAYPLTGLPPAGSILVSTNLPDHSYQLAPDYTQPNAIFVEATNPAALITFANPAPFSAVSFLSANANGDENLAVAIGHADGTWETNYFLSHDWFDSVPAAFTANGRIDLDTGVVNNLNNGVPHLFEAQFPLTDTESPVTSAWLLWTNAANTGGRTVVLAVSGSAGVPAPIISTQPASVAVSSGANVSFNVVVLGTGPFTYQWQVAGPSGVFSNLTDVVGAVSGSKTATLQLTAVTIDSSGVNFQVIVTSAGGTVTSQPATLTVYSTLANMAQPTDTIVAYAGNPNTSPEYVQSAIDGTTQKYLNFGLNDGQPYLGPCGMIWTPQVGSVIISGIRIFTANDEPERDPADFELDGSNDGGAHWTLIASNSIVLPTTRNTDTTTNAITLTDAFGEVDFLNTVGYISYRLSFQDVRDDATANSVQMAEVQFLGILNPSTAPFFTQEPQSVKAYDRGSASFTVLASGTPAPAYAWASGVNSVYTLLSDGGNISGSQTASLTVNPATYSDAVNYVCIATNTFGAATSSVATLTIVSSLTNVVYDTDPILTFGDEAVAQGGGPYYADDLGFYLLDGTTLKWQNGGSGFSTSAGFPPFQGPVGVVLTNETADLTAFRPTLVVGMRVFTADANPQCDPADYTLEGSLDGNTFTPIASGTLSLPLDRNADDGSAIDPLIQAFQEVGFSNYKTYPIYRVTFHNTRNNTTAAYMQMAEMQLLGVDASVAVPAITLTRGTTPGTIKITTSVPAELYSTTNLTSGTWVDEGTISGSITITPTPSTPQTYYRLGLF